SPTLGSALLMNPWIHGPSNIIAERPSEKNWRLPLLSSPIGMEPSSTIWRIFDHAYLMASRWRLPSASTQWASGPYSKRNEVAVVSTPACVTVGNTKPYWSIVPSPSLSTVSARAYSMSSSLVVGGPG